MHKTCPISGKSIPRRHVLHRDVYEIFGRFVIPNPVSGTLRRFVFDYGGYRASRIGK